MNTLSELSPEHTRRTSHIIIDIMHHYAAARHTEHFPGCCDPTALGVPPAQVAVSLAEPFAPKACFFIVRVHVL